MRPFPQVVCLIALAVAIPALGQIPDLGAPPPTGPTLRAQPRPVVAPKPAVLTPKSPATVARDELRAKIRAIRSRKLAAVIQPDAATTAKLSEIAERFEDQLEQTRAQAQTTKKALVKALAAPKPAHAEVTRLTQQLIDQRAKLTATETARETAVRAVLNPEQFAKLVLAWPTINREIREEIYRVLLKKKAGDDEI